MLSRKKTLRDSATGVADQLRPHVEEARAKAGPAIAEARAKAEPALREAAGKARAEGSRVALDARAKAQPLLEDARKNAGPALAEARKQVEPALDEARKRVKPALDEARDATAPYLAEARKRVEPALDEARKRVEPALDEARTKAAPLASEARRRAEDLYDEKVLPGVASALTKADDATAEIRHEVGRRGSAAASALKGEVQAPENDSEGSALRKVLFAVGMAGVAGFVAKKLGDRQAAQAWESAYTPKPPRPSEKSAAAASAATTAGSDQARHRADTAEKTADDVGGGNPSEAVADDADEPRPASTPDAPADVVDVEDQQH